MAARGEVQWVEWFPLFLLAVLKVFGGGGRRWALLAGLFYLLQSLSCMYWALYAPLLAVPVLLYLQWRQPLAWRDWKPLLAGLAVAALVTAMFFIPYARTARELGFERPPPISVRLDRHLDVLPGNWLYSKALGIARVNIIGEPEGQTPRELSFDAAAAYNKLFAWLLHRPHEARLDLDVPPQRVQAVRLRVKETDGFGMPWNVAEVRLFERSRP